MKTLIALVLLITATAFAGPVGPEPVPIASPSPTPSALFKASELDVAVFGIGAWTKSPYGQDQYLATDHAFGGALAVKYFAPLNLAGVQFGAGLDQTILDAKYNQNANGRRPVATSMLTLDARYPIGSFALYANLGGGAAYGGGTANQIHLTTPIKKALLLNDSKFLWSPAAGIEYRPVANFSVLMEFDWDQLGPKKNYGQLRAGIGYNF